jgi:ABC-type transport system substrate-binding protein
VLSLAAACAQPQNNAPDRNPTGEIHLGVAEGGSDSPDVGISEVWRSFAYEGLTLRGGDGRPLPRLARSWVVSDDGLRWTFTLQTGVVWHDGSPFTADAAVEALQRALKPQQRSALHPGLNDIVDVKADGPERVTLTLSAPSAFLVDDLDLRLQRPVVSAPAVGTGPFIPTSVSPARVEMRAHERYHGGAPQVARLIVSQHPTARQAWAELLRGELDAVWNVSAERTEFLSDSTIETRSFPRRYVYVLAFNSSRPQLRSPLVRRALNSAIDREALIRTALRGQGKAAWSPVWPEHWAYDQSGSTFGYAPALTRAALAGAGFPAKSEESRLRFSCLIPEGFDAVEKLALELQRALHNVGVDLLFESVALSDMEARMTSGTFDAVLLDLLSGPSLSRIYSFWHTPGSTPGLNVFGYSDPRVDGALDSLRRSASESVVRAATSELQRAFADNPPGVFIAWSERSRAVSRRVEVPTGQGLGPFQPFSQWRIRPGAEARREIAR